MIPFLVTIRLDEARTRDVTIKARSYFHVFWLYHQLYPQHTILAVRPVRRTP